MWSPEPTENEESGRNTTALVIAIVMTIRISGEREEEEENMAARRRKRNIEDAKVMMMTIHLGQKALTQKTEAAEDMIVRRGRSTKNPKDDIMIDTWQ